MCGYFNDIDGNRYRAYAGPSPVLRHETQRVERGMEGEPVPAHAWEAFFGPACGAIEWRWFERMFKARQIAVAFLATQQFAPLGARRPSALRCLPDDEPAPTHFRTSS